MTFNKLFSQQDVSVPVNDHHEETQRVHNLIPEYKVKENSKIQKENTSPNIGGVIYGARSRGTHAVSTVVQDGDTVTVAGGDKITTAAVLTDTVTVSHDSTTRSDTTSSASPAFGASFTVRRVAPRCWGYS